MATKSIIMLDREPVSVSSYGPAVDLGDYSSLETQIIVHSLGGTTAGGIKLQHSAVDEHQTYLGLTTLCALDSTGNTYEGESNFLRFVRWYADGDVNGAPVVTIRVLAKS